MFPVDIAKILRIVFLYNSSSGCFSQSYHSTVKSAGVPVLWFCASTCFRFRSKTFTKLCSNSFFTKTISCLLDLIGHVLLILEHVLKNINCFRFDEKLTQRCTRTMQYYISKTLHLHFAVGQVLSIWGYDLENEPWRWKYRFWFCSAFVYFADLKTIYFASCLCCSSKLF